MHWGAPRGIRPCFHVGFMLGSCWVYVGFMSVSIELDWDCGVIYEFPPVFDSDRFG